MSVIFVGAPIDVYPLEQQWVFNVSVNGVTGTRVYLKTDATMPTGVTTQVLPKIGDAWDVTYPSVTVKNIEVRNLNDNSNCGQVYTCSYDDVINFQLPDPIGSDDLPKNVEVTGELMSWEPKDNIWKWQSDDVGVVQPIFRNVSTAEITIPRVVKDFDVYMGVVMEKVNKTNNFAYFGFPIGALLFLGANFTQFQNRGGQTRWRVDLQFNARKVVGAIAVGANEWGWNTILREDSGIWDEPEGVAGEHLYDSTSFALLFESDALGNDESLYQTFPSS